VVIGNEHAHAAIHHLIPRRVSIGLGVAFIGLSGRAPNGPDPRMPKPFSQWLADNDTRN